MSAFEADRFNRSRTSPHRSVNSRAVLVNHTKVIRAALAEASSARQFSDDFHFNRRAIGLE